MKKKYIVRLLEPKKLLRKRRQTLMLVGGADQARTAVSSVLENHPGADIIDIFVEYTPRRRDEKTELKK